MIKGLYETHVFVENLERSMDFYENTLGLELGKYYEDLRSALYWIGKPQQSFVGLWEKPKEELKSLHFAFESTVDFIVNDSINFLTNNNIPIRDAFDLKERGPIVVFSWIPAVSVFFKTQMTTHQNLQQLWKENPNQNQELYPIRNGQKPTNKHYKEQYRFPNYRY